MFFPQQMPPRRAHQEPLIGSGGIVVGADAVRDARPQGFYARITAQPDTAVAAYGFSRVDDEGFAAITGDAAIFGDGSSLAAFEVTGRTDVPADGTAVVWCEPLRNAVGYGFRYAITASAGTVGGAAGKRSTTGYALSADDTWYQFPSPTGDFFGVVVPATGTYVVSAALQMSGAVSAGTGLLIGRVYNQTRAQELLVGSIPVSRWLVGTCCVLGVLQHFYSSTFFENVALTAGDQLILQGCRSLYGGGSAWSGTPTMGFLPSISASVGPLNRGALGLLKIG